ncbi:MAG: CoA transferase [Actinomycetia bacterium]|nr:CoA transferase [Actinomycetes bacterium]
MTGPLEGIKVLDLSQGAAGPTCAMALGDLGATVIKVEPPGGEWGRGLGPPFVGDVAAAYLGMNRNKRSIVIDLKNPAGAEVVLHLAEQCDVALESFRPGVSDRLGIGYEAMSSVNNSLVYAAISAFGQSGPWRDLPGVDGVAQAMGGIMSVTGTPTGPPVKVGLPAADMAAGVYASQTILAALFARERNGKGQRVDVSLLDSLLAYQVIPLSMYLASGQPPRRMGSAAPYAAPNEIFATSDGHVMVAAYVPKRWKALCVALGRPELATDPRFDTNEKRVADRPGLGEVLDPLFRERTTGEWIEQLREADILCGPLLTYPELMAEDHVAQGDTIVTVHHNAVGDVSAPAFPGRMSGTPCEYSAPPPPLAGEHTEKILAEFGYRNDEIQTLLRDRVVSGPSTQG